MTGEAAGLSELIVCSLEPWNDTWRRNQFLVHHLLEQHSQLRVLFVEPPADPLFDLASRHRPSLPKVRTVAGEPRLRAFRPLKPLPRRAGPLADRLLLAQIPLLARLLRMRHPVLWVNDVSYAPLIGSTGWPGLYDITDDWLLAPASPAELDRLTRLDDLALRASAEVVVCSAGLVASRSGRRSVTLIPNAVDTDHFRRPRARPVDLPSSPVAVYLGTLHDARIDVDLLVELAQARRDVNIALVGPDSLAEASRDRLRREPNVCLLGPRPYDVAPAYLQHADVLIVPHVVSAFTESLDPIKAYECLVVATPTVATPVAGFREHAETMTVADRAEFVSAVASALAAGSTRPNGDVPTWRNRAEEFGTLLVRAARAVSAT